MVCRVKEGRRPLLAMRVRSNEDDMSTYAADEDRLDIDGYQWVVVVGREGRGDARNGRLEVF